MTLILDTRGLGGDRGYGDSRQVHTSSGRDSWHASGGGSASGRCNDCTTVPYQLLVAIISLYFGHLLYHVCLMLLPKTNVKKKLSCIQIWYN